MKYTSKLEKTTEELSNCAKCKGLSECKLEIKGHIYYPNKKDEHLEFVYKPCKYFKKHKSEESKKESLPAQPTLEESKEQRSAS